ncbi:nuclear transport factor 2 family protein [Nonomuraea sp. NPDC000554]|uniref:nuclear transport factor 2 family protein n=1 Tax=Nonomuraea sp. NPDC000554 TaxID=3154259 RepID=UPI00331F7047
MKRDFDVEKFVDRYTAVWNEPDSEVRRETIAELWSEDGVEFTDSTEHRGRQAIEARIAQAYEQLVRQGGFVFRAAGDAVGHHDAVRFTTYMVPAAGGDIAWTGFVFARLDDDGRILQDYQFGDPPLPGVAKGGRPGTRAVVEEFLRLTREGDPERIAALYAPQVDWRVDWPVDEHPAVPWIRPRSTRADVADHFRAFGGHCVPAEGHVSIDDILVDGPDAVLFGTSSQQVKATGERFTMTFALRLTVEDGMLTRHHMYEDSLAVAEAFQAG